MVILPAGRSNQAANGWDRNLKTGPPPARTVCSWRLSQFHLMQGMRDNSSCDILVINPRINSTLSSNSDQWPWSLNHPERDTWSLFHTQKFQMVVFCDSACFNKEKGIQMQAFTVAPDTQGQSMFKQQCSLQVKDIHLLSCNSLFTYQSSMELMTKAVTALLATKGKAGRRHAQDAYKWQGHWKMHCVFRYYYAILCQITCVNWWDFRKTPIYITLSF